MEVDLASYNKCLQRCRYGHDSEGLLYFFTPGQNGGGHVPPFNCLRYGILMSVYVSVLVSVCLCTR